MGASRQEGHLTPFCSFGLPYGRAHGRDVANEGLHLEEAVQYCGLQGAVRTVTMWQMADVDEPDLWQRTPSYEKTSEALRDAVRVLRRKRNVSTIEEASIWMRNSESLCTH